jgi:SAM-dependent methyltransferase
MRMTPQVEDRFGAEFYRRHYFDRRTRVVTRADMARRADLVAAFARHGELRVRSILDVGCGLGLMRRQLLRSFPRARYTGLEFSEYLCDRYGWEQGSAADFDPGRTYDLVVCYDVLQYLDARAAAAAIRNLGRLCAGVPGAWYRRRLARDFINAGSGMFVRRGAPIHLWELDQVEVLRSRRG